MFRSSIRNTLLAVVSLAVLFCGGCGGDRTSVQPAATPKAKSPVVAKSTDIQQYTVQQIGETLGGYLPPLDEGRLRVAPPAGWRVRPRSNKYLVRFVFDPTRRSPLPQITITVEKAAFDEPYDLDKDTLLEFQDLVAEQMSPAERKSLLEPIKAMILGNVPCLRYVVAKGFQRGNKRIQGESQIIKTLHAGRIYTVTLDVYRGTLIANKNYAYVVVAGMEFLTPEDTAAKTAPASDSSKKAAPPEKRDDSSTK